MTMTNPEPEDGRGGDDPASVTASARPVKRSFSIAGHKTSISLEAAFWDALREAAARENLPLARLVQRIDQGRGTAGLSSAVRVWLLADARGGQRPPVV
jgi:predicted DNA-binding ribbon-helix-helix protein